MACRRSICQEAVTARLHNADYERLMHLSNSLHVRAPIAQFCSHEVTSQIPLADSGKGLGVLRGPGENYASRSHRPAQLA